MATEVSRILLCSISLLINCPSCNCRVFHKILWQVPVPVKKKDPPRSENKFRAFIKRSSEPLLHMQNQQQVRKNTLFPRNRDTYSSSFFIFYNAETVHLLAEPKPYSRGMTPKIDAYLVPCTDTNSTPWP